MDNVRSSDPATSRWAAEQLPRKKRAAQLLAAILDRWEGDGFDPDGVVFTDSDLARWSGMDRNIAARRRLDLFEAGMVTEVMHYLVIPPLQRTRVGPAGRAELVWTLTSDAYAYGRQP